MADAATQRLIDQIVQERVQAGALFTAYDVTLEARQRGGNVRHNDVRDLVHEYFEQGRMGAGYNRSLIDVGAPTKPWLYHRFTEHPSAYKSPSAGAPAAPRSAAPPAPPPTKPGIVTRIINTFFGNAAPSTGGAGSAPAPRAAGAPAQGRGSSPTPASSGKPQPRPASTAGLDSSPFLPITRDELKSSMKGTNLWSSAWFGRRDLIPPVTDKRTLLVDRAMVSQGLLSPEQLAEIHSVGAEMDLVRPDVIALKHQANLAGEAAVQQSREERQKLREQKKAAAAERKRQLAEGVLLRRATDIIYLGRGVSGRLGERTSDFAKLTSLELPVLNTPAEVATALGVTIPRLRWLAFHSDVAARTHYIHFTVPKKSGGLRTLSAPHRTLATAQEWIFNNILRKLAVQPAAQGFVPQRSILTNARQHVGRQIVVNMDLENFFPSITFSRVRKVFERAGYSSAVATVFALLCTECPRRKVEFNGQTWHVATGPRGLPQGACTSPALSNQVARRLDKRLQGLGQKLGLSYTRYADDLTISGDTELLTRVGYVMARLRHIAEDEGFVVNEKKSRVLRRNSAQTVTGLVVNDKPGVARSEVRRIRAILHQAKTAGLAAQNREQHPNFPAWLEGKIAYIGMARPELGAKLRQELARLRQGE